jgi:hypothetical protein
MIRIERVRRILLAPVQEWPEIEREPATIGGVCRDYVAWLALVPAIAGFIGASIVGYGSLGYGGRLGVGAGLVQLVVGFGLTLLGIWIVSRIVDWLAPTFGGTPNRLAAYKLVAYGSTAALLGGVFAVVPVLGLLGFLASLYSIYLIHVGLPVLMKSPPDRSLFYTIAVVVCAFVVNLLVAGIVGWFLPTGTVPGATDLSTESRRDGTGLTPEKAEELGRRIEEMGRRIEQAGRGGNGDDVARATREAVDDMARGTGGRTPLAAATLKAVLPETVDGMKRSGYEAESRSLMGLNMSSAKASYADGKRSLKLEIIDAGSAAGLLSSLTGWATVMVDRETETATERTYRDGERVISVRTEKDGSRSDYKLLLPNGIVVDARGRGLTPDEVAAVVARLDLRELEAAD